MDPESLRESIVKINKKIVELQEENMMLKRKVKDLEEKKRKNNLVFFGIEEQEREQSWETYEVILTVCWEGMGLDISNGQVKEIYRVGHGANWPILVKLANCMVKDMIMSKKSELKDSNIRIDSDFDYEVRCRRKVLVPFLKVARSNSHYTRLVKDKLKINGETFDVEFCLDSLNKSGIGENISEEKRKMLKDKRGKVAWRKSVVTSPQGHNKSVMCQVNESSNVDVCGVSERNEGNVSQQQVQKRDDRDKKEELVVRSESIEKLFQLTLVENGPGLGAWLCNSQEGSCLRIDMRAIPPGSTSAYIIDPTVRFEAQEQQPSDVHAEKCRIYEPTVPFYLEKYHLTSIKVVGLMVGARGTIPRLFASFCKKFQLNNDFIRDVSLAAIRGSLAILKYHLYFVS
ncbi:hypothetical protein ANN_27219 [Periplaneta americana]|uniref:Uncharacterized protein n=1 Tax=Periplaneta americana TaxID=6978 RepID=A0ABQ8RXZ6_PERAM|nr:hypothetical protein ANN_27219 [Periplaneta americana]